MNTTTSSTDSNTTSNTNPTNADKFFNPTISNSLLHRQVSLVLGEAKALEAIETWSAKVARLADETICLKCNESITRAFLWACLDADSLSQVLEVFDSLMLLPISNDNPYGIGEVI